jgi:hypothetical protein
VDNAVVFLQRQGKKLREMTFDIQRDGYVAPDLTLLAEHIMQSGVVQLAFARQPDPMILAVLGNGELAVCTYDREQQVTAWTRWVTDGVFESVCSVYGAQADEIWAVVRRTVGGSTVRYVEKLAAESESRTEARLLDCFSTGMLAGSWGGYDEYMEIRESAASDFHSIAQTGVGASVGAVWTLIVSLKAVGGRHAAIQLARSGNAGVAYVDLENGVVVAATSVGAGTAAAQVLGQVNGFWRVALSFDGLGLTNNFVTVFTSTSATAVTNHAGDTSKGLLVSRAMLAQGDIATVAALAYEETGGSAGTTNKLKYSNTFMDTVWVANNATKHGEAYWFSSATDVVSGLARLNGNTVKLVVDGVVLGKYAVSGGEITVPTSGVDVDGAWEYSVGLPYTAKVKPMKLDVVMANGPSQGKKRRITQLVLRFRNTYGAKFGKVDSALDTVSFSGTELFTGDKVVNFPLGHDRSGDIVVVQDQPMPFTLLGILASADFFGD